MKRKTRKKMRKNLKGGSSKESTKLTNILDTYKSSANKFFKAYKSSTNEFIKNKSIKQLDTILLELDKLNKPKYLSQYKLDAEEFSEFMQQWKLTYGAIKTMIYELTVDDETLAFGEQYSEPWQYAQEEQLSRSSSMDSNKANDSWDKISQKGLNPEHPNVMPPAMLESKIYRDDIGENNKWDNHQPLKPKKNSVYSRVPVTGGTKRKSLKKGTKRKSKKKSKKVFSIKRKPIIKGTRNIRNKRLIINKTKRKNKKKSKKKYKKNIKGGMFTCYDGLCKKYKEAKERFISPPPIDYNDLNKTLDQLTKLLKKDTDKDIIIQIINMLEHIKTQSNIDEEHKNRINKLIEQANMYKDAVSRGLRYRNPKF